MPKPMYQQAGSGLHLHQYLTRNGKNAFYEAGRYANFNDIGRWYIGGLLKHAHALAAFTNPSTNSYKRLVPGFEAPVAVTFGQANRSSCVRIPRYIYDPEETRLEYRPPDATGNPYLMLAAMLMAGIDGIVNKIDPEKEGYGPHDGRWPMQATSSSCRATSRKPSMRSRRTMSSCNAMMCSLPRSSRNGSRPSARRCMRSRPCRIPSNTSNTSVGK
jgi:hypothetical protein